MKVMEVKTSEGNRLRLTYDIGTNHVTVDLIEFDGSCGKRIHDQVLNEHDLLHGKELL